MCFAWIAFPTKIAHLLLNVLCSISSYCYKYFNDLTFNYLITSLINILFLKVNIATEGKFFTV